MAAGGQALDTLPDEHLFSRAHAASLDAHDVLAHLRGEFLVPSRVGLRATARGLLESSPAQALELTRAGSPDCTSPDPPDPCIYLCGHSLGLQPRRTAARVRQHLSAWATRGVLAHFQHPAADSPLPRSRWLDVDGEASRAMAPVVGARPGEVAVMQTLTANLHLLLSAFYRPVAGGRHRIILESKAFPTDHVSTPLHAPPSPLSGLTDAPASTLLNRRSATTASLLPTPSSPSSRPPSVLIPSLPSTYSR